MKRLFLPFLLLILFLIPISSRAIECGDSLPTGDSDALKDYINSCNQKISSNKDQQNTLKQVIGTLDSKISLAQAKVKQTEVQIVSLEKDIQVLSGVIDTVNVSMDQLTQVYIQRVRESYKNMRTDQLGILLTSGSLSHFLQGLKYQSLVKTKDQLILTELERSRLDYDQKKTNKVNKQQEIEKLKNTLLGQKKELDLQQADKKRLLLTTQNDEKKYQSLLSQAKEAVAALRRYVTSQGGATLLSGQTKCTDWGCYFSQRDSEWGNQLMGGSDMTLKEVGCLVTSTAMVASHYKKDLKPSDIAASSNPFFASTAYMVKGSWAVKGITVDRQTVSVSTSKIDEELSAGHPVIVGLYGGPAHFIVLKGKNDQGYVMNDPYLESGSDRQFSEKYSISDITQLNIVRVY